MKPVDHGIFNYHAATFPQELRQASYSAASRSAGAIDEAGCVLAKFDAFRAETMADKRLSPTGKRDALREWTDDPAPSAPRQP